MSTKVDQTIRIKGIRDGLLITVDAEGSGEWSAQLTAELEQKRDFLRGSRIALDTGKRPLGREQLARLRDLFAGYDLDLWAILSERRETRRAARELGLATRLPGSQTDLEGNLRSPAGAEHGEKTAVRSPTNGLDAGHYPETLFLKETLRSGRSIIHDGHVIIMGDVNPGAEIFAAGNVLIWGRLRGLVHAGALGDETAVICALELTPTQLRIAGQIAIPPDERPDVPVPEQALIRHDQIVVQPWHDRD